MGALATCCLIYEKLQHAKARGAKIYCEVAGGGATADAFHITAPHPDGLGAKNVMLVALDDAGMDASEIDYINTHGTSTPLGDGAEVKAILNVFGDHAFDLNISATKSMTGHCLGAAGAVESVAAILGLNNGFIFPSINCEDVHPEIAAIINPEKIPQQLIETDKLQVVAKASFGFGDVNVCVIFKKYEE